MTDQPRWSCSTCRGRVADPQAHAAETGHLAADNVPVIREQARHPNAGWARRLLAAIDRDQTTVQPASRAATHLPMDH